MAQRAHNFSAPEALSRKRITAPPTIVRRHKRPPTAMLFPHQCPGLRRARNERVRPLVGTCGSQAIATRILPRLCGWRGRYARLRFRQRARRPKRRAASEACRLTMSLSGRASPRIARCARTIVPARPARHSLCHGPLQALVRHPWHVRLMFVLERMRDRYAPI
jgi:hypothetical protein